MHEAEAKRKSWDNPTVKPTALNFQPDATLHAKIGVCDNVPKMSRLRILPENAALLSDKLIIKHYREDARQLPGQFRFYVQVCMACDER